MKHLLLLALSVTLLGCDGERLDPIAAAGPIRIAVLPDQARDILLSQYSPLLDYLANETSLEFELAIPRDYADLLDQFDAGRVDLAWFGGLTFTQAERQSQAEPLVFRDVDLQFTSCYLTQFSDTRTMISQFEGEDFSFGPRLSTSGHLMPRFFMEKEGVYPEQFFASLRYSAGHDQTAKSISVGTVALGVANCVIVQTLLENGLLGSDTIRIMETTPPYSDYVWAVSESLDEHIKITLLDAFLALDASFPEHREILRLQGANAYLPAASENFAMVRLAADRAGLFVEDSEN